MSNTNKNSNTLIANLVQLIKVAGPKMVPFLKAVTIYFLLVTFEHRGKVWSTILKCAPIFCLIIFVILYDGNKLLQKFNYGHKIILGLIFSSLGDALLNWNLFPHGMGAFGLAQICYITAFTFKPLKLWLGIFLYAFGAALVIIIHKSLDTVLLVGLPIYSCLLLTMSWRAISRVDNIKEFSSITKLLCAIGSVLFVISDGLIAFDKFYVDIPYSQILIMTTYYAAQFGITLSIVDLKIHPTERRPKTVNLTSSSRQSVQERHSVKSE